MCCTPFANTVSWMLFDEGSAMVNERRDISVPFALLGAVTALSAPTITPSTCTCVPAASCAMSAMDTKVKL